jgi:hypothetical protein
MDTDGPRFNLRKRVAEESLDLNSTPSPVTGLPTVNSAFLSGLFADVAKIQGNSDDLAHAVSHDPEILHESESAQGRRISLCPKKPRLGGISKIKQSVMNLNALVDSSIMKLQSKEASISSPPTLHVIFDGGVTADDVNASVSPSPTLPDLSRYDSLHFQLKCVSPEQSNSCTDLEITTDGAVFLAFPHLTATVHTIDARDVQHTSTLTRIVSDLQSSVTANDDSTQKESYGWFVEMDDDSEFERSDRRFSLGGSFNDGTCNDDAHRSTFLGSSAATSLSPDNMPSLIPSTLPRLTSPSATNALPALAFRAPTAPKASRDYDAAAEWAKAADTIDDVLGNFF